MTVDSTLSTSPVTGSLAEGQSRTDRLQLYYSVLLEVAHQSSASIDFHEFLQYTLAKLLEICKADSAFMLLAEEGSAFQYIGGCNANHKSLGEEAMWLSQNIIDRIYSSHDLVCVRDVARDPVLRNDVVLASRYLGAVIAIPVLHGKSLLGVVCISSQAAMPRLDTLDLSCLRAIVSQLSLVTDNALSYSEVARLNEAFESEVKERTAQFVQANGWLAENLQQTEARLAQQMDVEKKRTRFFSALSHELRAPVQLLLGHAYLSVEEGSVRLTDLQRNSLEVIIKTCEHLSELVTKVMDASKLDEGGMTLDPLPFDIRQLIEETVNLSRGLLNGKPVQLTSICPPDLPAVLGDQTRIRQVLLNLLSNACRFTDEGTITVRTYPAGDYAVIEIADTGTGIPADKLESIFESYVQADSLRSHAGSGLGLTISKQLIELHGGQLWVNSTVGSGSTFYFSLPIVLN